MDPLLCGSLSYNTQTDNGHLPNREEIFFPERPITYTYTYKKTFSCPLT